MDSLKIGKHYYMLDCISYLILLVVGFVTTDYVQGTVTDYSVYSQLGQKTSGTAHSGKFHLNRLFFTNNDEI